MRRLAIRQFIIPILTILFVTSTLSLTGCDVSSRSDMRKAEKMLKKADKANAEFWAETEYKKAQKFFEQAMDLGRERKINESRDFAADAFLWAEDAYLISVTRYEDMQEEKRRLQSSNE